ncbi:MAG: hypothetical protein Q9167_007267 [Letrouitia subvulpina]
MSHTPLGGSPLPRGPTSSQFSIHEDVENSDQGPKLQRLQHSGTRHTKTPSEGLAPLTSSKLGNVKAQSESRALSENKMKAEGSSMIDTQTVNVNSMDALLAKLSEQQASLAQQSDSHNEGLDKEKQTTQPSPTDSVAYAPATGTFGNESASNVAKENTNDIDASEMLRLRQELVATKDELARQRQELDQTRVITDTFEYAMGSSPEGLKRDIGTTANSGYVSNQPSTLQNVVPSHGSLVDERHPVNSGVTPTGLYAPVPSNVWASNRPVLPINTPPPGNQQFQQFQHPVANWGQPGARPWTQGPTGPAAPQLMIPAQQPSIEQQRSISGPVSPGAIGDGRIITDLHRFPGSFNARRANLHNQHQGQIMRQNRNSSWQAYGPSVGGFESLNISANPNASYQQLGVYQTPMAFQPRPIGTPLSPTAAEFQTTHRMATPWNGITPSSPGQTYVSPMEPLNYRRLLDRSVTCNWKYIVDKIVCNNDQQASIFLQQKLKVGTVEQKYEIVEAIIAQAYALMVNRFGNFLVQRCFEHGTPEQVVAIANTIRGNTLALSTDAFGCHVVQKAFDAVPEDYKAMMVHELLRRIPETVIHRYACHVWQKLFELRWSDSPPQIMKYVNEALRGMWHDVALGETGSLVVQNIFENCVEEDKRPCINEVLNSIDIVAHGQFGNWCIQHICEHGAPADKSRAIEHVLLYATEYSVDQFASKVVEKCLKIGGSEFLGRYLERVCEPRQARPRIPLIDISSDQYGNYLIQWILTNSNSQQREIVASHVRKHMVSLRGSKFGSRVGMLCCNPAYATHPGPAVGIIGQPPNNRYSGAPGGRYGFR